MMPLDPAPSSDQHPSPEQAHPRAAGKTRPKKPPKLQPDHCLNCGAGATGKFCAQCGQENKDHSVALGPLLSEGLAELASWDSKLLRTLVPLIIRPGFLTNEYNAGRRASYLSPLKLYLTVSVLFFLLMGWKHPVARIVHVKPSQITVGATQDTPGHQTAFEHMIKRGASKARQNPSVFLSALSDDIPKMMFFLLPLFAVSLKLLYLRRKRLYVEHLIFLLHTHAFAFLLLAPLLFLHPGWLAGVVSLVLLVYVLTAMRVVYKQGWSKTLLKFSLLSTGYVTLLTLCFAGTTLVALWLL